MSGGHPHVGSLHAPRATALHDVDATVKLVCLLGFLAAVVATPAPALGAFGVHAGLVGAAAARARLPARVLIRRLAVELPFVVFALALPFVGAGPRRELTGLPVTLSLSVPGTWAAWAILAKATLGTAATVVLAWTTPVADILGGLERLGVPRALTAIAGFMVRYLEVIAGELRRLQIARVSRGDDPRWAWQGRAVAATAGTLFVRAFERGERVHRAMVSRGFTGRFPPAATGGGRRAWFPAVLWPLAAGLAAVSGVWAR
jgi:cobalt/nickel transport system permease protein